MPKAAFQQPSFLGGEWSPTFQGRIDNPRYKTAMNVSSNGYPTEEGAWVKRSGFKDIGPTVLGNPARLFPFSVNEDSPFEVELSAGLLRVWNGDDPVIAQTANLLSISQSSPAQIVVDNGGSSWATGDIVQLIITSGSVYSYGSIPAQTMLLTKVSNNVFTLSDMYGGAPVDGSQLANTGVALGTAIIAKHYAPATPYANSDWYNVKTTMVEGTMFMWHPKYPPQSLTLNGVPAGVNTSFTFGEVVWQDGPYLDQVAGQGAGISAVADPVTLTLYSGAAYNGITGNAQGVGPNQTYFQPSDVGRLIRILNEPGVYNPATTYPAGTPVAFPGNGTDPNTYYSSLSIVEAGFTPPSSPIFWAETPESAIWVWAIIENYISPTQVGIHMEVEAFYDANPYVFQIGKFGDPIYGYPTCGCFHEGRLWIFGATDVDGSYAAPPFTVMAPTLLDGTVTDASAISYELETGDDSKSNLLWAISNSSGIVLGSNGGEWLIQASNLNDPITATSIQAHRVTKYRCSYVKPVQTPLSIVFVQRFQRKVMEFLQDVFTQRYVAPNLTTAAKHLTQAGIEEVVYNEELTPILWLRDLNGQLLGITYRRQSSFTTEEPVFTGWHRHVHGEPSQVFNSLCMSPANGNDNLIDYLYACTSNANTTGTYRLQRLVKQFDVDDDFASGFFLDSGVVPVGMVDVGTGVQLYGLNYHAGSTVAVVLGGVYMGTFTPDSNGILNVPYTSSVNAAYLQSLNEDTLGDAASTVAYITSPGGPVTQTPGMADLPSSFAQVGGGTANSYALAPNWGAQELVSIAGTIGSGTTWQLATYAAAPGAAITNTATVGTHAKMPLGAEIAGLAYTYDGDVLCQLTVDNASVVCKYTEALTFVSSMGTNNTTPGTAGDDIYISALFCSGYAGADLMFTAGNSSASNPGRVQVLNTDAMNQIGWTGSTLQNMGGGTCYCGRGFTNAELPTPAGPALFYAMEHTSDTSTTFYTYYIDPLAIGYNATLATWNSGTTYAIGNEVTLYDVAYVSNINSNTNNQPNGSNSTQWDLVQNPYVQVISIGTIAPTAIDATWTHLFVKDVGYDRTDGNMIIVVTTTDSVTNTQYLAKIDSANAAVLWKTPITYTNFVRQLSLSRIGNQTLSYVTDASSGTLTTYNTTTGAVVSTTALAPSGFQTNGYGWAAIDNLNGMAVFPASYNSATSGAPPPYSGVPSTFLEWAASAVDMGAAPTILTYNVPAIVGYDYSQSTRGQILRPGLSQDAGSANGPPQGKKRRVNQAAFLFQNTQAVQIGTNFSNMKPISFMTLGGTPYTTIELFDGVWWGQLNDDYSYDGMVAWQSTGPYPLTVVSVSGFLETQDY